MSAEPFDQDQPDDIAVWEDECAGIDKGYVIADEEPTPEQWDTLSRLDLIDDPRPEDERDPNVGAMQVALLAVAFAVVGIGWASVSVVAVAFG